MAKNAEEASVVALPMAFEKVELKSKTLIETETPRR
jgi:hypothetical protein